MISRARFGTFLSLTSAVTGALSFAGADPPVDFTREIRPILSQHCFACHGPDVEALEAGLSLYDHASATRELSPGVRAIVPGDPDASELWRRVNDASDPMPPTSVHKPLEPGQIELLRRWIEDGASYAPHWAYQVPQTPAGARQDRDRYDRFVSSALEARGLSMSGPADPITLMRRVSLDLTGLPPSIDEIDAFLADDPAIGTNVSSIAFWPVRTTVNVWPVTGSISCATRTPSATTGTRSTGSGPIGTG